MTKTKKQAMIVQFKDTYISFERQKETLPNHVLYSWVGWIHGKWDMGLITLKEYKSLLNINILEV